MFVDGFQVAEKFRRDHPRLFDVLTKIPASFQKIHNHRGRKIFIQHSKPHIVLNHRQKVIVLKFSYKFFKQEKLIKIIGVNWGPANEGPLRNLTEVIFCTSNK